MKTALLRPLTTHPIRSCVPSLDDARDCLRRVFGHADFRGRQAEVVAEALAGRSALAVLPTGGGKSVCYQIPAILRPGLGLVISPLIALMADQVEGLKQDGVAAERLDSNTTLDDRVETWRRIEAGELDLLYLSPEARFEYLLHQPESSDIGSLVNMAMPAASPARTR